MFDLGTFIEHYGYTAIFITLILGIVGLPLPDEILLTYVGYNVFLGTLSLKYSLITAMVGAIMGISVSYLLGLKLGLPFIKRFGPKLNITETRIEWAQNSFKAYGGFFLIVGYFLPGVRHITAYLAGMSTYRYFSFALFASIGAIIWTSSFILLGVFLGNNWTIVGNVFHQTSKIIWIALLALLIYFYIRANRAK
ncbi:alkaline phosphatase [Robertmurraya siralis]|uniref:Alkaline phosphatase n=1 Tax=Robertmurraya siralis TaxID=77777 RepID=A0A919WJM2_9BACI|nr:DedA family protein [Robertmurraya siralis]PAE18867.1 hypothetical protein CHH80_19695 [Bacillus sp. 7504-2]GIN63255.1 alkaline phosphatase [Robertmurraya siralis]